MDDIIKRAKHFGLRRWVEIYKTHADELIIYLEDETIKINSTIEIDLYKYEQHLLLWNLIKQLTRNWISLWDNLGDMEKIRMGINHIETEVKPYLIEAFGTNDREKLLEIHKKEEEKFKLHSYIKYLVEQAVFYGLNLPERLQNK